METGTTVFWNFRSSDHKLIGTSGVVVDNRWYMKTRNGGYKLHRWFNSQDLKCVKVAHDGCSTFIPYSKLYTS